MSEAMSGVKRYVALGPMMEPDEMRVGGYVLAADYDRLEQECDSVTGKFRTALLDKAQIEAERAAALKQVEGLRETLEKISAYAPCSGVKDPGFTKMHMGILARDAIAESEIKP